MNVFITTKVFNPELNGKAVRIEGLDRQGYEWNGICLVKDVKGENISLIDCNGDYYEFHIESFEVGWGDGQMSLTILEG